jgi:hypothetical protein
MKDPKLRRGARVGSTPAAHADQQSAHAPHVTLARLRGDGAAIARRHPLARDLAFVQEIVSVELFRPPPPGGTGYRVAASASLPTNSPSLSTPDAQ